MTVPSSVRREIIGPRISCGSLPGGRALVLLIQGCSRASPSQRYRFGLDSPLAPSVPSVSDASRAASGPTRTGLGHQNASRLLRLAALAWRSGPKSTAANSIRLSKGSE